MCERLSDVRAGLGRVAERFDAALLSAAEAERVVQVAAAIEKTAAAIKAAAAARVAETGVWRRSGDRSPAHHLARATGSTVGQAAEAIETARRLRSLPDAEAAARRGELSPAQAAAIAGAGRADPEAVGGLVRQARTASLGELRDACARAQAAADADAEARRRRIHDSRYLRTHTDADGAWNLHVRNNPEVGAEIMAALTPIRDRLVAAAQAAGRAVSSEAAGADALTELARSATADDHDGDGRAEDDSGRRNGARAAAKILVRVDLPALLRGHPAGGETCEVAGFGPVAVSAVRDLLDTADPFLAAVVTDGEGVVGVAHLGRRPNAHQQTALEWLYPGCAVLGCTMLGRLEVDHRAPWAHNHLTVFDLLDRLCRHHHDLKTYAGWALVEGRGKRAFVPADDPRHPRHAHDPPAPAATGPRGSP